MLSCVQRLGKSALTALRTPLRSAALSSSASGGAVANKVKAKLLAGEPTRGLWGMIPSADAHRLVARLPGLDWVLIDMEHGPIDVSVMGRIAASMGDAGGPVPIVRVPIGTAPHLKQAFDAGAMGVMLPMVNTRAQAQEAVAACKLPPVGVRSYGSPWAPLAMGRADMAEYIKKANEETLVVAQIESVEAVKNVDEILSVPGIDVAFVGPIDLSISLGIAAPRPDDTDERLVKAVDTVLEAGRRHGVACGIYCSDGANAKDRIRQGFNFVNVATDAISLVAQVESELAAAH